MKAIEAKGFAFTRPMMDNSSELARVINEASLTATDAVNRSMKELQDVDRHGDHPVGAARSTARSRNCRSRRARSSPSRPARSAVRSRSLTDTTGTAVDPVGHRRQPYGQGSSRTGRQGVIEQSRQTATATVAEILETHGMLRSDTTALFERLRDANSLLQEVLSRRPEQHRLDRAASVLARDRVRRAP